ncbi:MAG: hypothetical protein GWN84_14010, partial [Gammaproteobacteria bacterium]|nr:hypothetical protein [Gammaproteobacteria bacterium]NIR83919.1 hypothetical protein [Gammaproteobacteria bacterium]NIU05211.1 hypothetical protein [Gammaproteobacteria bacterium]NIX86484.1 hypothetical protein [Gammaproteobacteria bacterium]
DQMERLTGARVCWVERVKDPAKRAAYVAKYCGKAPHAFLGTKRYWTSQDWLPPEERERIETWKHRREWRVEHDPFPVVLERYRWDGYEVEEVDGGAWLTPPPVGEPRGPPGTLGEGRAGSSLSPSAPPSATPQQTNLTELWRYG